VNLTNELARQRNRDAAERTLMAWIRTCLSLISFGFGLDKIVAAIDRASGDQGPRPGVISVALAFVLACPLAWYVMREWLSAFEYRIPLGAGVFVLAGAMVLLLALLTVSYQSVKAAMFNPIDSLRKE
jgi:uncharacterized membrane protein YidH (DUF202 family)